VAEPQRQRFLFRIVFLVLAAVAAGVGLFAYFSPGSFVKDNNSAPPERLKTGGTSVAAHLMENRWRTAYRKDKGVEIEYVSVGSTEGIKHLTDKEYAICFTHAPLTEEQRKSAQDKGGAVVHVPVVLCAVVPVYNVKELKDKDEPLNFTAELLANIFVGNVKKWNDQAIKDLNPNVAGVLPDTAIVVVHRKDSSGTTLLFTHYLQGASKTWQGKVGRAGSEVPWPVGVGAERSRGVADLVARTEGAIGYVDLLYAWDDAPLDPAVKEPVRAAAESAPQYGAVRNGDDTAYIHPRAENITAAAQAALGDLGDEGKFHLTNRSGKDSYPICGVIWAVCYQEQPAAEQKKVVDFLRWLTHEAQPFAAGMSYAPLPKELVTHAEDKINSIKSR
jgi:phosphate transport system substrate-binding protein